MKGTKNDYSMSFYDQDTRTLFLGFVHDTDKAIAWANSKNISWTHANIYDRRTRNFIQRVYKNPK